MPAALALAALILAADPAPISAQPLYPRDAVLRQPSLSGEFIVPGITRPARDVTKSAPLDEPLLELCVREGDRVTAGQLLARLDDRVAAAAVDAARAISHRRGDLDAARAEFDAATRALARLERLTLESGSTPSELDDSRARAEGAAAALLTAQERQREALATLRVEEARLETYRIRAPFDGVVTSLLAQPGAALQVGDPIARVIALSTLRADLHLPAARLEHVKVGEPIQLHAGAPINATVDATITSIEPIIDAATGTIRCAVEIPNPSDQWPAGFAVIPASQPAPLATPEPSVE